MTDDHKSPSEPVSIVNVSQSRPNTTIGELFGELSNQITGLIRGEIELTKVKAQTLGKKAGLGAGLLAGAAVFALYMLGWIFHTIEVALNYGLPAWASALIVTGILLLIAAILAFVGLGAIKKGMASKPDPKVNMKLNVEAMKRGMKK